MFIGCNFELNSLQKHYDMGTFQFAVIYGRRRIGKTALINQFLNDKKAIFFTAAEENGDDNLCRLSEAIHFFQIQIFGMSQLLIVLIRLLSKLLILPRIRE